MTTAIKPRITGSDLNVSHHVDDPRNQAILDRNAAAYAALEGPLNPSPMRQ